MNRGQTHVSDLSRILLADPGQGRIVEEWLDRWARECDQKLMKQVQTELVYRFAAAERELVRLNGELSRQQEQLDADLKAAANIQKALLPKRWEKASDLHCAWQFVPSGRVGGDVFLLSPLDDHLLQVAIIDISGHGVPAAMVTVSVCQVLRAQMGLVVKGDPREGGSITPPSEVLRGLEREFPYMRFNKIFSIVYGLLDRRTGEFTFANAGHPHPLLVTRDGTGRFLEEHGPLIGIGTDDEFPPVTVRLEPGDRLYFFTDGLTEARNANEEFYAEERLQAFLAGRHERDLDGLLAETLAEVRAFMGREAFDDDFTLLGIEFPRRTQG